MDGICALLCLFAFVEMGYRVGLISMMLYAWGNVVAEYPSHTVSCRNAVFVLLWRER